MRRKRCGQRRAVLIHRRGLPVVAQSHASDNTRASVSERRAQSTHIVVRCTRQHDESNLRSSQGARQRRRSESLEASCLGVGPRTDLRIGGSCARRRAHSGLDAALERTGAQNDADRKRDEDPDDRDDVVTEVNHWVPPAECISETKKEVTGCRRSLPHGVDHSATPINAIATKARNTRVQPRGRGRKVDATA